MLLLIFWTQQQKNLAFFLFILFCFVTGFLVEFAGVHTGMVFGDYSYGKALGIGFKEIPLIIGVNWFITIYCCGVLIHTLLVKAIARIARETGAEPMRLKALSVIVDGATIAVFFDWVLEPVAIKLGFWQWKGDGEIPLYNYGCWFLVSMLMMMAFHYFNFSKHNKFAIHLLMIQIMFFLLLRTLL